MADPHSIIADAFSRLKRSVSDEDAHNFASTELQDVWSAVREIDARQRKRQSAQNLRRIEPLLRGIEKYTKVIEVLCNGTPYMPYVWAPIKLMLEIASHHRDVFEALLSAYSDIGASLPRFDRYKQTFSDNIEFQHSLASIYGGILDFHQRAYKFFRRRAWHVVFLSLWTDFRARFECIIDSLKKQRDFLDVEAASFDIAEAKESRTRMQDDILQRQKRELDIVQENEKNVRISQLRHAIAWLSSSETLQETQFERMLERRHDQTCEWITTEPLFRAWMKDDAQNQCLWINGKPGSGKSVMCSYIIKTLNETGGIATGYYFCNNQDTGNVCHQILTTVVLQILRQHPDVSSFIANEFTYRGVNCGTAQLRTLVPQLLDIVSFTRLVIDGIDECSNENQKAILKEIRALCASPTTRCKVILSSRREVLMLEHLSNHQIQLDERPQMATDIRCFVKYQVSALQTSDRALIDKIESTLVRKANGMFLWVKLVFNELQSCYNDAALEETVTVLPKGLNAAYGLILKRITDPDNPKKAGQMAIRMLEWMACSHKTLKSHEILDGIALDASNTILTSKTRVGKAILDLCRPLVEEGPAGTVDFVHFSAKEYILEDEYKAGRFFLCQETAHFNIAFSCIALLNSSITIIPDHSTEAQRAATIVRGFHGLQVYADVFWYEHLLEYCRLKSQHRRAIPGELLTQLQLLMRFRKEACQLPELSLRNEPDEVISNGPDLEVLDDMPDVKSLVTEVLAFRAKRTKVDTLDRSLDTISQRLCEIDRTHFSTVRYYYQKTVEALLDNNATIEFSTIDAKALQLFRDTYGTSGYVCRYLSCVFSADGFQTAAQRAKHEAQHQRQFHCAHPTCFCFAIGFTTRSLLQKHNEKYHPVFSGPSLAESLAALVSTRSPSLSPTRKPVSPRSSSGPSSTKPRSQSSPRTRPISRVEFHVGQEVAFKHKLPGSIEKPEWIQGRLVRVIGEGKSRRYDVKDLYPGDGAPNLFKSSASQMAPIPPEGLPLLDYEKGRRVLAMFPDTTTFYKAEVRAMIDDGKKVQIHFEGEEENELRVQDRRFVLDHRG